MSHLSVEDGQRQGCDTRVKVELLQGRGYCIKFESLKIHLLFLD